jgi:ABC-type transport system substrate-binding protein
MRNKISYIPIALGMLLLASMIATVPVHAFIYPNGSFDAKYEFYGPHVDQMQMKMYGGEDAMWTALQLGEIDITDWPLTTVWRNTFSTDTDVVVVSAGGEAGFYTVDMNYNPNQRMGNGSVGNRLNPVYDQVNNIPPISNNEFFRLGVGHLYDRATFSAFLGAAGVPILSPVPSYMGGYIWPGLLGYTFSRTEAEAQFALGKIKQDATWQRYWDRDNDNVVDAGEKEACVLKMTWRMDAYRKKAGQMIYAELLAMNFTFNSGLTGERTGGANYQQVMLDKNYHITTLGWIFIGPDPDFLYDLYHITGYWDDPESSAPNSAALNDSVLNSLSEQVKFALNAADAKAAAWQWQERFEAICAQVPLFSNNAYKAHSKWYTGGNDATIKPVDDGENLYRRKGDNSKREWLDIANQAGFGDNSWFTQINAYPNCTLYGAGGMTLRYGWKEQQYPKHINPFYSEWYWDSIVLGAMYDSMGYRDPYDLSVWKGDLIKSWTVGTWYDGVAKETKSKVAVTLRPDAKFQDGTPITIADVIFSFVEAGPLLIEHGFQPPWWWPTGELVRSLTQLDAYTIEILYDVQSFLAEGWTLGGFYIVPKHIWKPIIETGNPSMFAPDPNLIGSGPFRYKSMVAGSSLVMVANTPGSSVNTGLAPPNSNYPSSTKVSPGYHANCPIHVNAHTLLKLNTPLLTPVVNNTHWTMVKPYPAVVYNTTNWRDTNGNHILDQGDYVTLENLSVLPLNVPAIKGVYSVYMLEDLGGGVYNLYLDWYSAKLLVAHAAGVKPLEPWIVPTEFGITITNLASISHLTVNKYVYVDGVLQPGYPIDITLDHYEHEKELLNVILPKCNHNVTVAVHVKGPSTLDDGHPNPWISQWINVTTYTWTTILEDIGGTTYYDIIGLGSYPYKNQLPVPDCKVRVDDVLSAATAFGSNPGDPRWNSNCDVNRDYKVRVDDILAVALMFGAG